MLISKNTGINRRPLQVGVKCEHQLYGVSLTPRVLK